MRCPECKAVIESAHGLVLELHCPSCPAVSGLINAKICRVVSNRHQVRNARTEALHISEFQRLGAGYNTCIPSLPAVSSDGECAVSTACPDHLWIYGPYCDQAVGCPAVLRSQRRLMNERQFFCA